MLEIIQKLLTVNQNTINFLLLLIWTLIVFMVGFHFGRDG